MKNNIYIIAIIISSLFIFSCKNKSQNTLQKPLLKTEKHEDEIIVTKEQYKANNIQLGSLQKKHFPVLVKASGMIDVPPQSKQIISSFYGGTIKKSNLLIGDKVHKGQALVTIENPEFISLQQDYLETKEQLDYLKNEYERQKILFNENIISKKKYLQAKSNYNKIKASYKGLKQKLQVLNINITNVEKGNFVSFITLYSKISGYITKVNVSTGTHIEPNNVILEIVNTDHIHIELVVFEKDVMKIKKGQYINFKIPEISNKIYQAEVYLVGAQIDNQTRTVKVHGHLHDEKKNSFAIGMFVEAEIETSSKENYALPEEAIVENEGVDVVIVLEKETDKAYVFEPIPIKKGMVYSGFTEIISDIVKPDNKIIIKGAFDLVGAEDGGGHSH
jgi:cobalt-zinc-cadmium efflux system membrane fusion protein